MLLRSAIKRLRLPFWSYIYILMYLGWMPAALAAQEQAAAQDAEPPAKKPPISVVVDPRVELMSIIFRLAGNPEYGRGKVDSYTKDVEKQFGEFRTHPAVKLAQKLHQSRGVSFDACMNIAVYLRDAEKCEERVPLDPRPEELDGRWRIDEAREFLAATRQFVKDTHFDEFVAAHHTLYETTQSRMKDLLDKEAHLEWFDEFFGRRPQVSFNVALGLLNGPNNYGVRFVSADGKNEFYCVLGVWATDEKGLPAFDRSMMETVVHEFCHSYANPIIDLHEKELKSAGEKIFPSVEAAMRRQAYGNWKTMMYESLVRACTLRYTLRYDGRLAYLKATFLEKQRQFLWVGQLAKLLGEYENDRGRYRDLEAFAPKIAAFFNDYAEKLDNQQEAKSTNTPKVVDMIPKNGSTDIDPGLTQIRVVFDRPMMDNSWSLVGSGPNFPDLSGKPAYNPDRTVWTVDIKLKSDWTYKLMLNSDIYQNFKSADGVPLAPVEVTFKTRKKD